MKKVILFIPPFFSVCVREHIGVVCVYVAYEHLFMCTRASQRKPFDVWLYYSSLYTFETGAVIEPGSRLMALKIWDLLPLLFITPVSQSCRQLCPAFYVGAGI